MGQVLDVIQELKKLFEKDASVETDAAKKAAVSEPVGSYSSAEATAWIRDEQFYESD